MHVRCRYIERIDCHLVNVAGLTCSSYYKIIDKKVLYLSMYERSPVNRCHGPMDDIDPSMYGYTAMISRVKPSSEWK